MAFLSLRVWSLMISIRCLKSWIYKFYKEFVRRILLAGCNDEYSYFCATKLEQGRQTRTFLDREMVKYRTAMMDILRAGNVC
jgi:hypothetical protein